MMTHEIVERNKDLEVSWGKWRRIFDPLPFEKAILFSNLSKANATKMGNLVLGTMRKQRRVQYGLHFRVIPDGDSFQLYVWKEKNNSIVQPDAINIIDYLDPNEKNNIDSLGEYANG